MEDYLIDSGIHHERFTRIGFILADVCELSFPPKRGKA